MCEYGIYSIQWWILLIDINPRFSAGVAFSNLVGYDMISNHISAINGLRINQGRCYSDQILCKHYLESVIVQWEERI